MVSIKHLVFAALLGTAACAPTTTEPPPSAAQEEVASLWTADTRTILTGDAARSLAQQCSRVSPGPVEGVWTPTDADVDALEDDLLLRVARELESAGQVPSPGGYYRQYAGFVLGGKRVIYANGVDESAVGDERDTREAVRVPGYSWRTHAVRICDGGTITFGVEYDPATRQFSNFEFNGSLGGPVAN